MKKQLTLIFTSLALSPVVASTAQGTAFTYQGQMPQQQRPGQRHLRSQNFTLFPVSTAAALSAGPLTNAAVT